MFSRLSWYFARMSFSTSMYLSTPFFSKTCCTIL